MGNWFDRLAKHSASAPDAAAPDAQGGLTRRQVLARGAVVTGAAWSAPMLLSVQPAYAGASQCTDAKNPDYSVCNDPGGTFRCCPPGETCVVFLDGSYDCSTPPGGRCNNQGLGQTDCNGGRSRCNQPGGNPAVNPSVCGGPGATCGGNIVCAPMIDCATNSALFPVFGDNRCGGRGATCTTDDQCAGATNGQPATECTAGICTAI